MPAQRRRTPRAAFALIAALAVTLVVTAAGTASAADFQPEPGTVVIRDTLTRSDVVTFLVSDGAAIGEREVAAAATAAGIPNDGIEERASDQPGVRELRLRTTLSTRTGFLARRIDGQAVQDLDVFGRGRVVLSLHPWARVVDGRVRQLASDRLAQRYALDGDADVAYRIPAPAMLRALLLLLLLIAVPFVGLRVYASRVSRQDLDASDKAHRLRAGLLLPGLVLPLVLLATLYLGGLFQLPEALLGELAPGLARAPGAEATATMVFLFAIFLATVLPAARAVVPYYRELRGIEATPRSRAGSLRMALAFLLPILLWVVFFNLVSGSSESGLSQAVRLTLLALGWLALIVLMPSLAVRLMPTRPLEQPMRQRLNALLARAGVRVREIRVLDTREQKVANALVMGLLPRLRYVLVTDYLLEHLEQDEVEATVAHEIGHAKQHHLLIKLGATLLLIGLLGAAGGLAASLIRGAGALVVGAPIVLLLGLVLIQGGLGLVLERKADDYAARLVGVRPTIRALERIAELNMLKRRTGAAWNLLTHHPGFAQRVERLKSEERMALSGAGSGERERESGG